MRGIRTKLVDGAVVEKYLWSGLTTLLAVYDGNDSLAQRFEYSDGRLPSAMTMGGSLYYLAYDQVGSLRLVSDASGNIVKQVDYDSFGNIIADNNRAFPVPFGFAGGLHDRDTGLVRFGYRDYMPEIGKWTAKDPILFAGGDSNLYGYVFNNPINSIDPKGLATLGWDISVTAGGGAGGTAGYTYVIDSQLNIAKIRHSGGGSYGGLSAGGASQFQATNAPTVNDLTGSSVSTGGSFGPKIVEVTGEWIAMPNGYQGLNIGAGASLGPIPVEFHSMIEYSDIIWQNNMQQIVLDAIQS